MSDINWDLAPEGAVELKETAETGYLRWFNEKGQAYGAYGWFPARDHFKTIATRPQPEQEKDGECYAVQMKNLIKEAKANGFEIEQVDSGVNWRKIQPERKTVEDAVDAFNGEWPISVKLPDREGWWFHSDGTLVWSYELGVKKHYKVCTREEFEACVAAKSKSEPEWTNGIPPSEIYCRVNHGGEVVNCYLIGRDDMGAFVYRIDGQYHSTMSESNFKPIKPTITKAEAWDKLTKLNSKYQNMDTMTAIMTLCDECEVVE